jgi:diguanylate cyclase (GGDEF)-like protein
MATMPDDAGELLPPEWGDHLIAIGRAGLRASTLADARSAIVNACVGLAGFEHAVLCLRGPHPEPGAASSALVHSDGLSLDDAAAISVTFGDDDPADNPAGVVQGELMRDGRQLWVIRVSVEATKEPMASLFLIRGGAAENPTSDAQIARLATEHVRLALRHAAAEEDVRVQAFERRLFARLTDAIVGMQDLGSVMSEVAAVVRAVSGWEGVAVVSYVRDADWLAVEATDGVDEPTPALPLVGERLRLADWPSLRFALDNCTPYQLTRDQAEALTVAERENLAILGIESLLAVPFALNGEAAGLMLLYSGAARSLNTRCLASVQEIGVKAALAFQHNQYVGLARQQAIEQAALLRVSKAIISGQDLYAVLAEIARAALGFSGVEGCRVLLAHDDEERFEVGACQSVRDWPMYYQVSDTYPFADWPTSRTVLKDKVARGYLVTDPELTARERANHVADQIQSLHRFPIVIGEDAVGVLTFMSRVSRRFTPNTVRIGHELAAQAANAVDRARLFGKLQRRAETDGLTGLLNHRTAFETLDRELAAARKLDEPLSIIIVDLDDFKLFNDTHGHLVGDKVLIEVSNALRDSSRPRDYVARFGGDEFLLILPATSRSQAAQVAERILRRMSGTSVLVEKLELPIRISVGVATFPHDAGTRQELIAYGDAAMYSAKECGGGQLGSIERRTRSLEVTVFGALSGLVRAVDRKDRYTKDHSDLVAEYSVRFGKYLELSADELDALDVAGQLHDIGKIAVPDSVLRKPGQLTPEEEAMIRQHVVFSEMIIKGIPNLDHVLAAVANHHERWDGSGYPYGKRGLEIPLLGRILTMADALAAMTLDRPYRKGRTRDEAIAELRSGAGTQFDPNLVEDFIAAISTDTAILRDEDRRRRWSARDAAGSQSEVVGMTDYLRLKHVKLESADEQRDSA